MMNTNIKVSRRWLFWGLFAVLMLFLFFRYALMIMFPPLVFVAILALIAFVGDRDEILAVCMMCIPLSMIIPYYYVIIFCAVIYFGKYGNDIHLGFSFIPILLIVGWELCHCFSDNSTLKEIMAMMVPYLLILWLLSTRNLQSVDYGLVVRPFSFLMMWLCVILVWRILALSDYNVEVAFFNMQRLGLSEEEGNELVINPNSLGILCVLAASGLNQLRLNRGRKVGDTILMIMILALGALTVSRTYLACLIIMIIYLLATSKGAKKKLKLFVGVAVVVLIGLLLLHMIFPSVLESFVRRLQVDDITGGRVELFAQYNDYLLSSPKALLGGIGALGMKDKVVFQYAIAPNVPHNGVQEILVAWGIPGLLFFVGLIFVLIRGSKKVNLRQTAINYLPFLIIFVKVQVGQLVTSTYTLLALSFAYLSLCQNFSATEKQQTDYSSVNSNTDQ